jgi:hypothetical protein
LGFILKFSTEIFIYKDTMSEDIREMIDKVKNFNSFISENISNNIKSGVEFVYKRQPELTNIGTPEQYSRYLGSIFPNSKVKGIFYHGSPNKFSEFKDTSSSGLSHIWFSEKPLTGQYGENIYVVLLDIKNPLSEYEPDYNQEIKGYESPMNPDWVNNYDVTGELPKFKYDGTIRASRVDGGRSITVRNPRQIHILGSKQDVEGFENFIKN